MTDPARIYNPEVLSDVAGFYKGLTALIEEHFPEFGDQPAYVYAMEIVIQHKDDWTIGRIGMDDFPYFEITDEDYGKDNSS